MMQSTLHMWDRHSPISIAETPVLFQACYAEKIGLSADDEPRNLNHASGFLNLFSKGGKVS